MKKLVSLILVLTLLLTSCASPQISEESDKSTQKSEEKPVLESEKATENKKEEDKLVEDIVIEESEFVFTNLDDEEFHDYLAQSLYTNLLLELSPDEDFFIDNIEVKYISKEYLEETEYNSRKNIFFGYSLADLEDIFNDEVFIFTTGEDGSTVVSEPLDYDDTYEKVIKNVATGGGVILVILTVSYLSAGTAPAASFILASSAKTGTRIALASGLFSGVMAGTMEGIRSKDFSKALDVAALRGSQGLKWGAITGVIGGGLGATTSLKGATLNGLSMNQAALIQKESGFPLDVIKEFNSMEQYQIAKDAGLWPELISNKTALIRDIDLNQVDKLTGITNKERILRGNAPLDPSGNPFELHHIGQKADGTLAILTDAEHRLGGNDKIWHKLIPKSEIDRNLFQQIKREFWQDYLNLMTQGG